MELFGKEVLPQFDKDPVHSTTQYREAASPGVSLPATFVELADRVSNWGRWGDDDEIGTLNLIDGDAVRRGAAAVRTGKRFSLAVRLDQHSPQVGSIPGRINPLHTMVAINTRVPGLARRVLHERRHRHDGPAGGDALGRAQPRELWRPALQRVPGVVDHGGGRERQGVASHKVRTLTSRGVLLDVARAHGPRAARRRLRDHAAATSTARSSSRDVVLEPGDVVLVRTGQHAAVQGA